MEWTIEENSSEHDTDLVIRADGVIQGMVSVELYSNGPFIKHLTVNRMETAAEVIRQASGYLLDHYGQPYGVYAYTYDYKDYEQSWFKEVGFSVFRYLDEGARKIGRAHV